MTESEQLQKSAREAYLRERLEDLGQYLDTLFTELESAHKARTKHGTMMAVVAMTWWISIMAVLHFGGPWLSVIENFANALFWLVLMREWLFILPHYFGIMDEIRGCLKTLEVLGIMDINRRDGRRLKKYRESWMAKMWEVLKAKKMREVFA